ncbi:MAG: tetratricopeptide repeat protein [Fimbriimonadaceae bacterium]
MLVTALIVMAPMTVMAQDNMLDSKPQMASNSQSPSRMDPENIDGSKVNRNTQNGIYKWVTEYKKAVDVGDEENRAKAITELEALHEKDALNLNLITWLGYIYTVNGEQGKASAMLEKGHMKSKDNAVNALNARNLSAAYYLAQNYERAAQVLMNLDEVEPNNGNTKALLGSCYVLRGMHREAIPHLLAAKQLLKDDPDSLRNINIDLGICLFRTDNPVHAMDIFDELKSDEALTSDQRAWMGFIYLQNNRLEDAINVLEKAYEMDDQNPAVVNNLATAYQKRNTAGDSNRALSLFEQLMTLAPNNATAAYNVGSMYLAKGDFARAKSNLQKSISIARDAYAYNNLGRAQEGLNDFAGAAASYAAASDMDSRNGLFARNAGVTYSRLGNDANTVKYLERAMANGQKDEKVVINLAAAYSKLNRQADADRVLRESGAINSMSQDADYWFNRGANMQEVGNMDEAEAAYKKCLTLSRDRYDAHNNLGILYFESGRYEEAFVVFERMVTLNPDSIDAKTNLAACMVKTGRNEDAISLWKDILHKDNSRTDVRLNLADALWNSGDTAGARFHYASVAKSSPNNVRAINGLGMWALLQTETKDALDLFKKAVDTDRSFLPAYVNLAICHERLNDTNAAIKTLEAALKVNSEYQPAKDMLSRLKSAQ